MSCPPCYYSSACYEKKGGYGVFIPDGSYARKTVMSLLLPQKDSRGGTTKVRSVLYAFREENDPPVWAVVEPTTIAQAWVRPSWQSFINLRLIFFVLDGKFLPHFVRLAAGFTSLGAFSRYTWRTRPFEYHRCNTLYEPQHCIGQCTDFPLRPVA